MLLNSVMTESPVIDTAQGFLHQPLSYSWITPLVVDICGGLREDSAKRINLLLFIITSVCNFLHLE